MWTRFSSARDGRQQDRAERLPLLRREVEQERRVADHPVFWSTRPIGRNKLGEVNPRRLALFRAREGYLRTEAAGFACDGAGRDLAARYGDTVIELSPERRRIEINRTRCIDEADGRREHLRLGRQRFRIADLPFVLGREAVEHLDAGLLARSCRRERRHDIREHLVAVRRTERGDRAPRPHKGETELAEGLLGLARVRAVQHRGVAIEFGVRNPNGLQGGSDAVLIGVRDDDVVAELGEGDQRRARGVLGASDDRSALAQDLPDSRDGRTVAVSVGVVVAEVDLRSQLAERFDQGDEPLGRRVVDDDHASAFDRPSRVDLGGEGCTLLRLEGLRKNDVLEADHFDLLATMWH